MERLYYVYILASRSRSLYIRVTNDLMRRIHEHRTKLMHGFTADYNINRLIAFEVFSNARDAIAREKELKGWRREKKLALIDDKNATWIDLAEEWFKKEKKMQIPHP